MIVGALFFESQPVFSCYYLEIDRILLLEFDSVFYLFSQYSYRCGVKLDAITFCYISVVLTGHSFENLHVFCPFKVLCVLKFTIIKEENDLSLQEYSITTWKDKFLLIFENSSWLSKLPVKIERP